MKLSNGSPLATVVGCNGVLGVKLFGCLRVKGCEPFIEVTAEFLTNDTDKCVDCAGVDTFVKSRFAKCGFCRFGSGSSCY
jgi:hypothetical protein